jgi:hypothetical protein
MVALAAAGAFVGLFGVWVVLPGFFPGSSSANNTENLKWTGLSQISLGIRLDGTIHANGNLRLHGSFVV